MRAFVTILLFSVLSLPAMGQVLETEGLKIEKISDNVFQHISYLEISGYGSYPCNGMIYFNGEQAVVFDTPVDVQATKELMAWIKNDQKKEIKTVVVTHFHIDCLGGLAEFHANGIPSYANELTIELASGKQEILPQHSFKDELKLKVGDEKIIMKYFGKGHTQDNIVAYIPSENVLFGGCLIKEQDAGKGNLADASPTDWPETVKKIKATWPGIKKVIPGHGNPGSSALLDYTIGLFEKP